MGITTHSGINRGMGGGTTMWKNNEIFYHPPDSIPIHHRYAYRLRCKSMEEFFTLFPPDSTDIRGENKVVWEGNR